MMDFMTNESLTSIGFSILIYKTRFRSGQRFANSLLVLTEFQYGGGITGLGFGTLPQSGQLLFLSVLIISLP